MKNDTRDYTAKIQYWKGRKDNAKNNRDRNYCRKNFNYFIYKQNELKNESHKV